MYDYFNNAIFICGILALLFAAVSFCHLAKVYNTYCDLLETLKGDMEKMDSFSDDIRRQVRERIDVIGNSLQKEVRKHYAGVMKRGGNVARQDFFRRDCKGHSGTAGRKLPGTDSKA